jgi:hypothetical protein
MQAAARFTRLASADVAAEIDDASDSSAGSSAAGEWQQCCSSSAAAIMSAAWKWRERTQQSIRSAAADLTAVGPVTGAAYIVGGSEHASQAWSDDVIMSPQHATIQFMLCLHVTN